MRGLFRLLPPVTHSLCPLVGLGVRLLVHMVRLLSHGICLQTEVIMGPPAGSADCGPAGQAPHSHLNLSAQVDSSSWGL